MARTQNEMVLDYMKRFGSITTFQAVTDLGCLRLASRINDLRNAGYKISSTMIKVKNRYGNYVSVAEYRMEDENGVK